MATDGKENENVHQNEAIGSWLVSIPHSNLGQNTHSQKKRFLNMWKQLCFGVIFFGYGTYMPIYSFSLLHLLRNLL